MKKLERHGLVGVGGKGGEFHPIVYGEDVTALEDAYAALEREHERVVADNVIAREMILQFEDRDIQHTGGFGRQCRYTVVDKKAVWECYCGLSDLYARARAYLAEREKGNG